MIRCPGLPLRGNAAAVETDPGERRGGPAATAGGAIAALAAAFVLSLALAACAPTSGTGGGKGSLDSGQPQALWNAFIAGSGAQVRSFSLSASLSVQSPQKSARLLVRFWGDLEKPLRLDLSTGMGQTFSMWREDSLGWLAIYPLSNQAFTHPDTKAALSKLNMPLPFGLKELAAISTGRYGLILPGAFKGVRKTSSGYEYALAQPCPVGSVTLDFEGKPIHFTGRGVEPWTADLGDFPAAASGERDVQGDLGREFAARKIQLTTPGGLRVILLVKKLELSPTPMAPETLELPLPPGARHIPLDRPGDVRAPDMP